VFICISFVKSKSQEELSLRNLLFLSKGSTGAMASASIPQDDLPLVPFDSRIGKIKKEIKELDSKSKRGCKQTTDNVVLKKQVGTGYASEIERSISKDNWIV
jgi:hypothetical protein